MVKRHILTPQEVHQHQRLYSGSRLNPNQVANIKSRPRELVRNLAREFGVSVWTIRAIRRGDIWDWVEPETEDSLEVLTQPDPEVLEKSQALFKEMLAKDQPKAETPLPYLRPSTDPPPAQMSLPQTPEELDRQAAALQAEKTASLDAQLNRILKFLGELGWTLDLVKERWNSLGDNKARNDWANAVFRKQFTEKPPTLGRSEQAPSTGPSNGLLSKLGIK